MDTPGGRARLKGIRRVTMSDFYGIEPGAIPGFADAGDGKFIGVQGLPERTVRHMVTFMGKLRGMYEQDALAFEVCVRHVASVIEDQRRGEGKADPRGNPGQ
jgi:hypothetical protein